MKERQAASAIFGQCAGRNLRMGFRSVEGGHFQFAHQADQGHNESQGLGQDQPMAFRIGCDCADLPAPGGYRWNQQGQQKGRFVGKYLGQCAGRAYHREAIQGVRPGQADAQGQQAEQVQRHDQVAREAIGWVDPCHGHVKCRRQPACQCYDRYDLFLCQQLDGIGQRLEPARAHPVLQQGQQLPVGPFVRQPSGQQEQPTGENRQGHDCPQTAHLFSLA